MKNSHDFLVGTVLGFQALAGEVKIKPSTNSPDMLVDLKSVRIEYAQGMSPTGDLDVMLNVRSCRLDKRMLLMMFDGLMDRNAVEDLEGAKVYAKESELLPLVEEEFWVSDLVGMSVFTTDGALVGKVISIIGSANDLLEVQGEQDSGGKTILIPFVKAIVPTVDMKAKRIEVRDIPGLLEPQ